MKKGYGTVIYAAFCTLLLAGGLIGVFFFAWNTGITQTVLAVVGMIVGFVLAPVFHELGHIWFARASGMRCVYCKCFCFCVRDCAGKRRFSFASPFAPDQTQTIPVHGGNMQKRAERYTLGGLITEGVFTALALIAAIVLACLHKPSFLLWGILPYAAYLFLLNAVPLAYPSGKTDALVYKGIKKGEAAESNMLAAMEIQGQLYEGKSYAQIDARYYFDLPQLAEDEPLFAVMQELRYRYYLEKNDYQAAADALNRLTQAQAYMTDEEAEKIAAELTYMHALGGDYERASACGKLCESYLKSGEAASLRILAAYTAAFGDKESVDLLLANAEKALENERVKGNATAERILLTRICG